MRFAPLTVLSGLIVPKAYKGQKALYLELQRDRLDAVIKHPAHPLSELISN